MIVDDSLFIDLPIATYATDARGRISFYNQAAADLWGHRPHLGTTGWPGTFWFSWPDGRALALEEAPAMATLKDARSVRGMELTTVRPDGTHEHFVAYSGQLSDESGRVNGALNMMLDGPRRGAMLEQERLAAIVSSSDDAIISKTLEGRITSWNDSATRIFGYQPEEMIGQSIIRIIPRELWHEEEMILGKIREGERVDHFDTVRVAKDGRRVDISLTVSPLRNASGRIIGASKVARDVSERKHSEALQRLLVAELNHRVRNSLTMIQAIARLSLRQLTTPEEFVAAFTGRVQTFANVHDLLVRGGMQGVDLADLLRAQLPPAARGQPCVICAGPMISLRPRVAVQMALVLHELATNARKHGALAVPGGALSVTWEISSASNELALEWKESGLPCLVTPAAPRVGMKMINRSLDANGGDVRVEYAPGGLICRISLPLDEDPSDRFDGAGM